jgi:EmrB/QacA subfamily drug resistance transporter
VNDATSLPRAQKISTLVGTLLGMLLAALDQTIVATAGPAIQQDLHIQPALYAWLTTSYLVASAVMTPIWGKLSDLFGRRRILVTGISIFLLGSMLCGVSQTTEQLIGARVIQGLGSASLFTTAFAVIADIFPPHERGRYAGLFGAVFGLSSVAGPLVGGFITDTLGWHWCFFINAPVGAIALFVILTRMPPLRPAASAIRPIVDVVGAGLFALGIVPLLVAASLAKFELRPGDVGLLWSSPPIVGLVVAGVIFGVACVFWERRTPEPIIDLGLFRSSDFSVGILASFVVGMTFLAAIVFLPLFMVNVGGASATEAGLTTTPLTFGIVAGNIFAGQMSSRVGRYKPLLVGSLVILVVGFIVMSTTLTIDVSRGGMAARMVLLGLGLGPSIPLFNLHIQLAVTSDKIGAATSLATLSRSLGSTLGVAIFGNVFGLTLAHRMEEHLAQATATLPPAVVTSLEGSRGGGAAVGEDAPASRAFDEAAVVEGVRAGFAARRATVVDEATRARIDRAEADAVAGVARVGLAIKTAFTEAVSRLYAIAIAFALLGLGLALRMRERPLRLGAAAAPSE